MSTPPLSPVVQVIDLVDPAKGESWRERKPTTATATDDALDLGISPPATSSSSSSSSSSSMSSSSTAGAGDHHNPNRRPPNPIPAAPGHTIPVTKGIPRWVLPVVACLAYSMTSMATTLSNKAIINFYSFDYPLFLTVFQNAFVVVFVLLLGQWGSISVEPLESRKVSAWLPLNMCFVLMLVTSQLSLGLISVAMVTVFKNFTTIAITLGDRIFFDNPISPSIAGSLGIMAVGSIVAGYNDLEFRADGYFYLFLNCAFQTTYTLYLNKLMRTLNLNKWSMVYYNNIIAIPLLIPCFFFFKELDTILSAEAWSIPSFWVLLFLNGSCSVGISMCSFWAMGLTSPTTTSMVGSFNKIPLTIVGSIIFKTPFNAIGRASTMVGLGGALVYTWAKSRKTRVVVAPEQQQR
jgi:GDP-mannose transporter